MIALGVDIGGTALKMGLIASSGQCLQKEEAPLDFFSENAAPLDTILAGARAFLSRAKEQPACVGISATGQVDGVAGVIAGTCGNLPGWAHTPLKQAFTDALGLPAFVMNDANSALLGETWMGSARGARHAVMVTIGTGLGGGILVDGRIVQGRIGLAGEIGHMPIKTDGQRCTCGNIGCWEVYASTKALVARAEAACAQRPLDGRRVFAMAQAGNRDILAVLDAWIDDVARGLVGLVHLFNPETILIGGGVSAQEALFVVPLQARLQALVMPCFRDGLRIVPALLGNDAGIYGAARHALTAAQEASP